MKKSYQELVDIVLRTADIILLVIDARKVHESINRDIEKDVTKRRKRVIYVINKCDLVQKEDIKELKVKNYVRISALNHLGTTKLLKKINELARGREVTVGVVGFPNTGKSTLINALKEKKSAPTSPVSGYTKGLQKIRISNNIMM